ncbi:SDR family NAD(P)-dependent oxidoreductase [Nocardioides fonticola]
MSVVAGVGSGRTAVVIGGASGIGAACVDRLRTDGWRVVVGDLVAADGVLPVDVTDEAAVAAFLDAAVPEGGLGLAVVTAGVSTLARVVDHPVEEWRRVVDVCLTGSFIALQAAARRMDAGGSVVLLSSLNASAPGTGLAAYCAAKAGLDMLVQVAALELGPRGVRVNAVAPGLVPTPLTAPALDIDGIEDDYLAGMPLGRAGTPAEIAAAVAYLADAGWVTGETLRLDGGAHLRAYPDLVARVEAAFGM